MAQYLDTWRVHVRLSKFVCAPVCRGAQGEFCGLYDANRCGISSRLYRPDGILRDSVRITVQKRGQFAQMYPAGMK
jgi:hypothetical protein